jgi:hypothetical protein
VPGAGRRFALTASLEPRRRGAGAEKGLAGGIAGAAAGGNFVVGVAAEGVLWVTTRSKRALRCW